MKTRGRDSSASLEVAKIANINAVQRPDAPYDLSQEETEVWWTVVNSKPADWFPPSTHGLLKSYCRHAANADRIARSLNDAWKAPEQDVGLLDKLSAMHERESRAMSSLATRMRTSQHSTYDPKKQKGYTIENSSGAIV